ncbi:MULTISPECIES: enoyl-CoA hydratase/isomerase family protein [Pseudomonadaceae]|uniref:enoyl-CoA hydratase/isomerase family protein n=1 Tax=Pseudomonadaceae TaxID=135621 RepID=UPI00103F1B55|nr:MULTISPECIES: enoyl-CoA hydratase/isomerase family protein [Pseudomonadaceae]MBA1276249.1 enoyl-CoA hydratase [Stutzerimonas stutzeri]MBC8648758.1 enoyl-CoA hydratase [Pseudomonas sp. MT4]QXY92733.1 enoyl-CoA hydratase [Pseudomonas sp. MTM4]TCD22387.1 enoyl-CoA hydratase [Pseudomonas sp. IC_126]
MSDQNQGTVECHIDQGVAWVGFNRPESRNAMTWHMYESLAAICQQVDADPAVNAVIFHGRGGDAFVAGTDIKQFTGFDGEQGVAYERRIDSAIAGLETMRKPTIAMLEGFCVGGGAAIALACDFRYCTPSLKFGVPIARTLGNCLSVTNVSRLMDLIGVARTKEVLMAAKFIEAPEAALIGLVNEIFDADAIRQEVNNRAQAFASRAPLTVQASKEVINRVLAHRRAAADASDDWVRACYGSQDFKAAVGKFVHKTSFEWTGR